jgi:HEAT repeat protein
MAADISELVAGLTHSDPAKRREAAERLSRLGPDAREAAVPLVRACAEKEEIRNWAAAALEELGPPRCADVGSLASLLGDPDGDVAYWAATLLGRLEGQAASAVPALAAAVASRSGVGVRQRAVWALGRIGPPAVDALEALVQAAADENPRLARLARRAIDRIGC